MKVLKYILFFLCVYIYLYNPIFQSVGYGMIKILLFISFIYVFFQKSLLLNFLSTFKHEIFFTLSIAFYAFLTEIWGDQLGKIVAYQHIIWFLECFLIPVFLVFFFKDIFRKIPWENTIIIIGTIAALITLFLIINPEINAVVRLSIIMDTLDANSDSWDFRGFSLAEGSSYSYGIVQGLILAICLFKLKDSLYFIIPILLLFISIIFNARIGIAPVAVVLFLIFFLGKLNMKSIFLIIAIVIVGFWLLSESSFSQQNEDSLTWGLSIFEDTSNFIKGQDDSSNYSVLINDMSFFPNNLIHIIFGEGKDIFYATNNNSDIGYVLQIFRGGIVYLFIMLLFLWKLFKRNYKYAPNKFLPILFLITILIVNIKGNALFISHGFFRLFIFYYIYCLFPVETQQNSISKLTIN